MPYRTLIRRFYFDSIPISVWSPLKQDNFIRKQLSLLPILSISISYSSCQMYIFRNTWHLPGYLPAPASDRQNGKMGRSYTVSLFYDRHAYIDRLTCARSLETGSRWKESLSRGDYSPPSVRGC